MVSTLVVTEEEVAFMYLLIVHCSVRIVCVQCLCNTQQHIFNSCNYKVANKWSTQSQE